MNFLQNEDDDEVVVTLKNAEDDDLNIEMDSENRYSIHFWCLLFCFYRIEKIEIFRAEF